MRGWEHYLRAEEHCNEAQSEPRGTANFDYHIRLGMLHAKLAEASALAWANGGVGREHDGGYGEELELGLYEGNKSP